MLEPAVGSADVGHGVVKEGGIEAVGATDRLFVGSFVMFDEQEETKL